MIEVDTTLVCGCLLSLRPLFKKFSPSQTPFSERVGSLSKAERPAGAIKGREYMNLSTDKIPLETINEEAQPQSSNSRS